MPCDIHNIFPPILFTFIISQVQLNNFLLWSKCGGLIFFQRRNNSADFAYPVFKLTAIQLLHVTIHIVCVYFFNSMPFTIHRLIRSVIVVQKYTVEEQEINKYFSRSAL